jgi:hypothetical protein
MMNNTESYLGYNPSALAAMTAGNYQYAISNISAVVCGNYACGYDATNCVNRTIPNHGQLTVLLPILGTSCLEQYVARVTSDCISLDHTVRTAHGYKSLANLLEGDVIYSSDTFAKVLIIYYRVVSPSRMFRFSVTDLIHFDVTRNHFVNTSRGLLIASEVIVGDLVYTVEGREVPIKKISRVLSSGFISFMTNTSFVDVNNLTISAMATYDVLGVDCR